MMTGDLMVCELLCYLMNKYGNSPNDSLKSIILSFYTSIKIASAKDVIYRAVAPLTADCLPRLVQRQKGDDKPRHDVDDIFTLVDALDDRALLGHVHAITSHRRSSNRIWGLHALWLLNDSAPTSEQLQRTPRQVVTSFSPRPKHVASVRSCPNHQC